VTRRNNQGQSQKGLEVKLEPAPYDAKKRAGKTVIEKERSNVQYKSRKSECESVGNTLDEVMCLHSAISKRRLCQSRSDMINSEALIE
jgi:hypothetical protein